MFCKNCGNQIPEGSRFCSHCGSMVQPTQQPESKTAPYTIPVDAPTAFKEQMKQYPNYTVPLDQNTAQQPNPYIPPVQQSQYTAPVQETPYTVPVKEIPYTVPKLDVPNIPPIEPPKYIPPVQEVPPFVPSAPITQPKKRVRKLPILLGAIALVAVLIIALAGGGKEEPEKPEPAKPAQPAVVETQPEAKTTKNYDDEKFLFSHEEFAKIYASVVEENGYPYTLPESYAILEDGEQRNLQHQGNDAIYFGTREDQSGNITNVYVGNNMLTKGYEDVTEEEAEVMLLIIEAAHGNMTEELWNVLLDAEPTLASDSIDIYEVPMDGLMVKITATETTFGVEITIDPTAETPAPKPKKEALDSADVLARYPKGTTRFDHTAFKFTHEELAVLYQADLEAQNLPYQVGKYTTTDDVKFNYQLLNDQGEKVAFMIWEIDPATGRVIKAGINYTFQGSASEDEYAFEPAFRMMEVCHGNMGDSHWDYIDEKEPLAERDSYIMYQYKLDGMKATMTLRVDNYNLSIEVDD